MERHGDNHGITKAYKKTERISFSMFAGVTKIRVSPDLENPGEINHFT